MSITARSAKAKGDKAEREVVSMLRDHLGDHIVRPRLEGDNDHGDVSGTPELTHQVKSYADVARALRDGLADLAVQKQNTGTTWGALWIRRRGGRFAVVMEPEDFISLYREALIGGKP
jgi:hypothetical protein